MTPQTPQDQEGRYVVRRDPDPEPTDDPRDTGEAWIVWDTETDTAESDWFTDTDARVEAAKLNDGAVTSDNADRLGTFGSHRKIGTTRISLFTVPPGTPFQTPEGLKAEDEECRIAFDSQGGVYPIRESVFQETYALTEPPSPDQLPDPGLTRRRR